MFDKPDKEIVYSDDPEHFGEATLEEAIDRAINQDWGGHLKPGVTITIHQGEVRACKPSDYAPDAWHILEDMECRASDDVGEVAEGFMFCEDEAREELEEFLKQWSDKHLACHFYAVDNIKEIEVTLTEEHFE